MGGSLCQCPTVFQTLPRCVQEPACRRNPKTPFLGGGHPSAHRAVDVLLWALAHPRWAFVFQPKYAAYLNLIEPWWKVLRSLALKGHRFATWEEVGQAISVATHYWNAHRHPFLWGHRKHHHPTRPTGIACLPVAA